MSDISNRQSDLLLSIIGEFIETAEAVGSISLQSKYNLDFSPATIRNEMAELVMLGYLYQKHLSSGRIPTTKGWRYFINSFANKFKDEMSSDMKDYIFQHLKGVRKDYQGLIRKSIQFLSELTHNASIAIIDKDLYHAGLSQLVSIPEFRDSSNLKRILSILEDYATLSEILNRSTPDDDINILIGDETGKEEFYEYAVVFSEIRINGRKQGYIAVIGPNRMNYTKVIPTLKYISDSIRALIMDKNSGGI